MENINELKYATISFPDQLEIGELEVTDISIKWDTDFVPHPASSIHTPVDFTSASGFISIPCDDETFDLGDNDFTYSFSYDRQDIKRQLDEDFVPYLILYNSVSKILDHAWLSVFDR